MMPNLFRSSHGVSSQYASSHGVSRLPSDRQSVDTRMRIKTALCRAKKAPKGAPAFATTVHKQIMPVTAVTRVARALTGTLALALALAVTPALPAHAVDTSGRTNAEVRAMWQNLKPTYTGSNPFVVTPQVSAPHTPGSLTSGYMADALGTINFARYLTGLPSDVVLDATLNETSQYGAVLLAASGKNNFSHTPPKPSNMAQDFYDRGYYSTSRSNIGWSSSTSLTAAEFEKLCLGDADSGNTPLVGHRRWLLNPAMQKTGVGYARGSDGGFFTTYAFDTSRAQAVDYDYVAWPSAGPFPKEFMTSSTPWSITLNPLRYRWDTSGHTVTLKRLSDNQTWTFDARDTTTAGQNFQAKYFNTNFNH